MKSRSVFLATGISTLLGSATVALAPTAAAAQVDLLRADWTPTETCDSPGGPIRVEQLDIGTWMLRELSCVHREAPFMFLFVGAEKALLVDTGTQDESDLVSLVGERLASNGLAYGDLTVAHTHSHLDHRSGDGAFVDAGATVVGPALVDVKEFWGFEGWPEGRSAVDLGGRTVEAFPLPGHNDNSIALFDSQTGILLTGDSMLRGSVNVSDLGAFRESVARLSSFISSSQVRVVLGGHLEREGVPLGLDPDAAAELEALSMRAGFFRPRASGAQFAVLYLRPILLAMAGGIVLFVVSVVRKIIKRFGRAGSSSRAHPA